MASSKYFGSRSFAVPFRFGDSGVEFFFVLSGFIITWVHFHDFGRPVGLLKYLRKRAVRIYPAYWIVFASVYLLAQVSPTVRSTVPHDFQTILKSLALVPQNAYASAGNGAPVLVVAWSLQYEICFYALFAILIANRSLGILLSIALLANVGACLDGACSFPRSFFASNLILLFGLGVLVAYCSKSSIRLKHPTVIATAAAIAFLSYGVLEAVAGTEMLPVDRRLIYGLFSAVLILALVRSEDSGRLEIKNRWLSLLGDSSYSLYLIHYPLISVLCKLMIFVGLAGTAGAIIAYPIILCLCVFTALAFHLTVEKPMLRALSNHGSPATLGHAATPRRLGQH